ncbi:MAG: Gfo/Idh/MocA family oxidoreductase [Pirellulaceae bacterium]|nr:Gfo/Idh/MocA family oxidoreductase [Pirellulaceae bacterium]
MSQTKVAVIGAGHLGKIHTRLLKSIPGFELIAVADTNPKACEAITSEFQVPCVADFKTLAGKIDAAIIATPTVVHLESALWCLENGIHCFVEKPLVRSARHADLLIQVAEHRNLTLQVGHVERFNPAWQSFKPLAYQISYIDAHRTSSYSGRSTDIGVVFDLMIHDLDLVLDCIESPVASVSASGQAILGEHEDWAEARIQFANGAVANLYASRVSRHAVRRMSLCGLGIAADLDFAASSCHVVEACDEVIQGVFQADKLPEDERRSLHTTLFDRWLPHRQLDTTPVNAIEMELRDFGKSIQTREMPLVSGKKVRNTIDVAERILEALALSSQLRSQAIAAEESPSIIHAAHRFGVRRAS